MKDSHTKTSKAFTLLEIIIAIIIIGILAGLALPQYRLVKELQIAAEGKNILLTLLSSLKRYTIDFGGNPSPTSCTTGLNKLDVPFPCKGVGGVSGNARVGQHYQNITLLNAGAGFWIYRADNDERPIYILKIDKEGVFSCCEKQDCCSACVTAEKGLNGICRKILQR